MPEYNDPLFDFTGKVVLITGGSRGLGYEMAKAFAARGADLIITSRKAGNCEAVAAEIRGMGQKALAYACHVGHWDELDGLVDAAYDTFGKVDILINNAGMSPVTATSADVSEALFDKVIGVNFKGAFRLSSLIGHRMAAGAGGNIINISSSAAIRPLPQAIPYAGAKAALRVMGEAFAAEFAGKVRVNTISAGPFLTDISKAWPQEMRESMHSAVGRPGNPDEIVTAALFLASAHSSFVSAAMLRVDGGIY